MKPRNLADITFVFVFLAVFVMSSHTQAATLRAAWLFDDATLSGLGPDATTGTLIDNPGLPPAFVPGVFGGQGLLFSGATPDEVVFPGTMQSLQFGTDSFSIVAWIRSNVNLSGDNVRYLRTQDAPGNSDGFHLFYNGGSDTLRFNQKGGGPLLQSDSTSTPADDGNHLWVVTRANDGTVKFYRDGIPADAVTNPGPAQDLVNGFDLTLASAFGNPTPTNQLTLDDIAFFDGILTDSEIASIAMDGLPQFIPEPSGLLLIFVGLLTISVQRRL